MATVAHRHDGGRASRNCDDRGAHDPGDGEDNQRTAALIGIVCQILCGNGFHPKATNDLFWDEISTSPISANTMSTTAPFIGRVTV
jgi:hypothetical protein